MLEQQIKKEIELLDKGQGPSVQKVMGTNHDIAMWEKVRKRILRKFLLQHSVDLQLTDFGILLTCLFIFSCKINILAQTL